MTRAGGRSALALVLLALGGCASPGAVVRLVRDPAARAVRAQVDGGVVEGVAAPGGRAWLGLAYAEPPVGPLRWRAPRGPLPWAGVRKAVRPGGDCVQNLSPGALLGRPGGLFVRGREDCLVLNVYAPPDAVEGAGLPVMVWLHGGGYAAGTAANYDPSRLATRRGVVMVTLNYRLGAFGFLAHPALSAEDPAAGSGDYALLDQQAALRWVRDNVAAFGGDPSRVTLWGQSAGGFSACHQLHAPGARGLFARVIVESGACTGRGDNLPLARAEAAGRRFARDLGCPRDGAAAAACLRRAPAGRVARVVSHRPGVLGPNSWGAVAGGPVLPRPAADAFAAGEFAPVPVLMGTNADEGRLFAYLLRLTGRLGSAKSYRAVLAAAYGADAPLVEARYPVAAYGSPALAYARAVTDGAFRCPLARAAPLLAARAPVWTYVFADRRAPSVLPRLPGFPPLGAYHGAEIAYVFQRPWILADPRRLDAAGRRLSDDMQARWAAFARTGAPDAPGLDRWLRWPASHLFAPAGATPAAAPPDADTCALWTRLEADGSASGGPVPPVTPPRA